MRTLQCGFGLGADTPTNNKIQSGGYTIGTGADTSRGGTNTLQVVYSGSGGGACYWEWLQNYYYFNALGAGSASFLRAGTINACCLRFDFKWNPPAATNSHELFR